MQNLHTHLTQQLLAVVYDNLTFCTFVFDILNYINFTFWLKVLFVLETKSKRLNSELDAKLAIQLAISQDTYKLTKLRAITFSI